MSAKTGLNVHESMKALITSVIRNETDIRVVDIRGSRDNVSSAITASSSFTSVVEGEAADSSVPGVYDPLSEPGASFWKGYEAPNWLSKEAMLPRFMNVSDGIKVMFVGGPLTGTKSSFILSYAESVTFETHVSNVMFKKCKIPVNDKKKLDFVLWDTFINEYDPPASTLTNLTVGFVVGYDITNRESVDFVRTKLAGILKGCPSATIMVIGNKVDSDFNRQVSTEEGQALARELGASLFFESSI